QGDYRDSAHSWRRCVLERSPDETDAAAICERFDFAARSARKTERPGAGSFPADRRRAWDAADRRRIARQHEDRRVLPGAYHGEIGAAQCARIGSVCGRMVTQRERRMTNWRAGAHLLA